MKAITQKTFRVENAEWIKMPRSCWGRYARVSVTGPDGTEWSSGPVCMGSTVRCAHAKALVEAAEVCETLNRKARRNFMARTCRAAKKQAALEMGLIHITRCCVV